MVKSKPIRLFIPKEPEKFTTNPYDVIGERELEEIRKEPNSFIHVILPKGEDEERYENAKKELDRMVKENILEEQSPSFYLYKQSNGEWTQRGLVGGFDLEDYGNGNIKIHEKTREKPLRDRIKHIKNTEAQTGLVWLTVKSNEDLKKVFDETEKTEPFKAFEKYGWKNKLWKIPKEIEEEIKKILEPVNLYIADGHHRIASAYEYMKSKEEGPWNYLMAYVANDDEVRVLPYNRVIKKLPIPFEDFMEKIKENFEVVEGGIPEKRTICMYHDKWYKLVTKEVPEDSVKSLDASILQNKILGPILGIENPRKDPNIFFEGGKQRWEKYVEEGNDLVFSLFPTSVREVEKVADAGRDMPPKSTWFDPKLLSGLVVYLFY